MERRSAAIGRAASARRRAAAIIGQRQERVAPRTIHQMPTAEQPTAGCGCRGGKSCGRGRHADRHRRLRRQVAEGRTLTAIPPTLEERHRRIEPARLCARRRESAASRRSSGTKMPARSSNFAWRQERNEAAAESRCRGHVTATTRALHPRAAAAVTCAAAARCTTGTSAPAPPPCTPRRKRCRAQRHSRGEAHAHRLRWHEHVEHERDEGKSATPRSCQAHPRGPTAAAPTQPPPQVALPPIPPSPWPRPAQLGARQTVRRRYARPAGPSSRAGAPPPCPALRQFGVTLAGRGEDAGHSTARVGLEVGQLRAAGGSCGGARTGGFGRGRKGARTTPFSTSLT